MSRAGRARRERSSRRLNARPRRPAGPASFRSFVSRVLRLPVRLALAALLCAGAASVAAPAAADVLVSNVGQSLEGDGTALSSKDVAQGFTTGANSAGYTLSSIEIAFITAPGSSSTVTVKLAKGSLPTSTNTPEMVTLTNPASWSTGNNIFNAPAGTTLASSTTYYVIVEGDGGTTDAVGDGDEDAGGKSGWSIRNGWHTRAASSTGAWTENTNVVLPIRVNGTEVTCTGAEPSGIWVACMTVGRDSRSTSVGFNGASPSFGSLSDTEFEYDGNTYVVRSIDNRTSHYTSIYLDPGLPSSKMSRLTVHYGSSSFNFGDLTEGTIGGSTRSYITLEAQSWTVGDLIWVRITEAPDTEAPEVDSAEVTAAKPKELVLTFDEALATDSVPDKAQFTVKVGGTAEPAIKSVAIDSSDATKVRLGLAVALDSSQAGVTVDYAKPSANPLKDAANNEVAAFTGQAVTNNAPACPTGQPGIAFWTACLTVGYDGLFTYGFGGIVGDLSVKSFTRGITEYTIGDLSRGGVFSISFTANPRPASESWVLQVGSRSYALSERDTYDAGSHTYIWNTPGFSWSSANNGDKVSVSLRAAPTVANTIPDQTATVGTAFTYQFPTSTFANIGATPTYTVVKDGEADLPSWLTFTPGTRTFTGTPQPGDAGTLPVKVTASVGADSVSTSFDIVVSSSTDGICGRTEEVVTAIVAKITATDNCGDVTTAHLAAITGTLDLDSHSLSSLRAGDFDGLTKLTKLVLQRNSLTTLPANVFDDLTALTGLWLNNNSLAALPEGIFDNLTALTILNLQRNSGAPFRPTANAGVDQSVPTDASVTLSGTVTGPWGDNVTWAWIQVDGANSDTAVTSDPVALTGAGTAAPTFTAPATATTLYFRLVATPVPGHSAQVGRERSAADWVTVTVNPRPAVDETAPEVSSAAVDGDTLEITFNEDLAAASNLAITAFEVTKGSSNTVVNLTGTPSIGGKTVTLTLASAVTAGDTNIRVDYTKPTSGANNKLQDASDNEVATFANRAVDNNTLPTVTAAEVTAAKPKELVLTFDDALATGSVPVAGQFTVKVGGTAEPAIGTVVIDAGDATKVRLGLAVALDASQANVTVDYAKPSSSPLKDADGNEVAGFTGRAVTNRAPACPTGQPVDAFWTACLTVADAGSNVFGFMGGDGDLSAKTFTRGGSTYTIDALGRGSATIAISFAGDPRPASESWILQVANHAYAVGAADDYASGESTYSWNDSGRGWAAANIGDKVPVSLRSTDTTAPALSTATVAADTLTLTWDEPLKEGADPAPGDFTVTARGNRVTVSSVAVAGNRVTLTLADPVSHGWTVTLSYTPGTDRIMDPNGNEAGRLVNQAVENLTGESGLVIAPSGSVDVNEGGMATWTVALDGAPSATVTLAVSSSDTGAATVTPSRLVFTTMDWQTPQLVTVTGVEDADEDDEQVRVTHTGSGVTPADVTVWVNDDEGAVCPEYPDYRWSMQVAEGKSFRFRPGPASTDPCNLLDNALTWSATLRNGDPLPSWLSFDPATQVFSGVPRNVGEPEQGLSVVNFRVKLTGVDGGGRTETKGFNLNVFPDTGGPMLVAAYAKGTKVTLEFDETLKSGAIDNTFVVTVGGTSSPVSSAVVAGSTVTLTLSSGVSPGDAVLVGYIAPTGSNAAPLQDPEGNEVATFTNRTAVSRYLIRLAAVSASVAEGETAVFRVTIDPVPARYVPDGRRVVFGADWTRVHCRGAGCAHGARDFGRRGGNAGGSVYLAWNFPSKTIRIPIAVDDVTEGSETFKLKISEAGLSRYGESVVSFAVEPAEVTVEITEVSESNIVWVPGAPLIRAAEQGDGQVTLRWDAPENADDVNAAITGWQFRYGAVDFKGGKFGFGQWTDMEGATAETTSHVVTGLENGTAYGFQLRAMAGAVAGPASATIVNAIMLPPQLLSPRLSGSVPAPEGGKDSSDTRSLEELVDAGCRVDVAAEFLDGDGDAVSVESLGADAFTVTNGRVGTPVKDADGLGWTVPAWSSAGFTGLMRVRLAASDRWSAAEQAFRVEGGASCAAAAKNELASLEVGISALDPPFTGGTTAYTAEVLASTDWVTVSADAVYGGAAVAILPDDAEDETGHQVALAEGANTVTVTVTPGDGSAARTYTVTVTRAADPGVLTGFVRVDASNDADLGAVADGAVLSVPASGSYGFRAETEEGAVVGSVVLTLAGPGEDAPQTQTENVAPWSLWGDSAGGADGGRAEAGRALAAGSYTLSATAYAERNGAGEVLGKRSVSFTVTRPQVQTQAPPATGPLTGFVLVDTATQATVATLSEGTEVDFGANTGGTYGIKANVKADAEIGSVVLSLTGAKPETVTRTENWKPYSLYGDDNTGADSSLNGAALPAGSYTLSATAYAGRGATGDVLGRRSVSFTVLSAPALSVADARAEEGTDASLDFVVRLDRSAKETVTVDYATSDGTAQAGADYTAASGTLTFAAGETSKTVSVAVLDDTHDEGEETMTLTLSGPSGATVSDAQATGTIANSDPIPQAWLARFGRTVAEQALDAVRDRLAADRAPGFRGRIAGEALPSVTGTDTAREAEPAAEARDTDTADAGTAEDGDSMAIPEFTEGGRLAFLALLAPQRDDGEGGVARMPASRAATAEDALSGTAFELVRETDDGLSLGLWGRVARSGFGGRDGDLELDGETASVMLGTDWKRRDALFGLMLFRSRGEGGYAGPEGGGRIETDLAGLVPWAGLRRDGGPTLWGAVGTGRGGMTLTPGEQDPVDAGLGWSMAAAGAAGAPARFDAFGGVEAGWRADALWTRTASDAVTGLAAASGETVRLRLGLEAAWERTLASGAVLVPRLEAGLRLDGGDAESGFGLEAGGGVRFEDAGRGLSVSLDGRTLAIHEDGDFEDWGMALSVEWDPRPETRLGPSVIATRGWGGAPSGGVAALLDAETLPGLDDGGGAGSLGLEMAWGTDLSSWRHGMTGSAYGRVSGSPDAEELRLGWRIAPDAGHEEVLNHDFWLEPETDGEAGIGAGLSWSAERMRVRSSTGIDFGAREGGGLEAGFRLTREW